MSTSAASPGLTFAALRKAYNNSFQALKSLVTAVLLPNTRKAALDHCFDVLVRPHFCP